MNPIFDAACEADIATLTQVTTPATEPLDYGVDLSCTFDVTEDFAEVDEHSPRAIAEALIRRLTTPRGIVGPNYGFDLRAFCNRTTTLAELRALNSQISAEGRKDDRVSDLGVVVTSSLATQSLDVKIVISPADPALTSFALTFSVTSAGVLLDTLTVTTGA